MQSTYVEEEEEEEQQQQESNPSLLFTARIKAACHSFHLPLSKSPANILGGAAGDQ